MLGPVLHLTLSATHRSNSNWSPLSSACHRHIQHSISMSLSCPTWQQQVQHGNFICNMATSRHPIWQQHVQHGNSMYSMATLFPTGQQPVQHHLEYIITYLSCCHQVTLLVSAWHFLFSTYKSNILPPCPVSSPTHHYMFNMSPSSIRHTPGT